MCFTFLNFGFELLKRVRSALLQNIEIPLISSFFSRQLVQKPFFLIEGHLYLMKKYDKVLLEPTSEQTALQT
jgi:hypothetical protein